MPYIIEVIMLVNESYISMKFIQKSNAVVLNRGAAGVRGAASYHFYWPSELFLATRGAAKYSNTSPRVPRSKKVEKHWYLMHCCKYRAEWQVATNPCPCIQEIRTNLSLNHPHKFKMELESENRAFVQVYKSVQSWNKEINQKSDLKVSRSIFQ